MITCYIIDSDLKATNTLCDLIVKTPGLKLIGHTKDPIIGLNFVIDSKASMLTFVDINMPELSYIEFPGTINLSTSIIFTSGYPNHAFEAFEKEAFDYLVKPFTQARLTKSIVKYNSQLNKNQAIKEDHFYVKGEVKGKLIRVNTKDIIYIEGALNYVIIRMINGEKLITYLTMNEIQDYLIKDAFSRVHKSFIVNDDRIHHFTGNELVLTDKTVIKIGNAYKDSCFGKLNRSVLRTKIP